MLSSIRALLSGATLSAAVVLPAAAQVVREGARSSPRDAQITFGYLCDDRFVVRNEGDQPVNLEYGLAKNDERTALSLEGKESVELLLSTSDELELLSRGTVIASARREYRNCADLEGEGAHIVVRPLVIRSSPTVIIAPYPVYRAYYDPWYRHHHHVYHRPIVRPVVRAVVRIPIIIGGRRDNDRGRDYDRGRDNDRGRDYDRGRDTRSNDRFSARPTGRINGRDVARDNGRGNGNANGRDNGRGNGNGNGRDNNNGRRGR
jgi:hypothetical protein